MGHRTSSSRAANLPSRLNRYAGAWLLTLFFVTGQLLPFAPSMGRGSAGSARPEVCRPAMRCSSDPRHCCCRKPLKTAAFKQCAGGEGEQFLRASLDPYLTPPISRPLPLPAAPELPRPQPRPRPMTPFLAPPLPPPPEAVG